VRKLAAFGISLAALAFATTPVMASDANGNHEAYQWVVAGDTAMAPDGSTIFLAGVGKLQAGPGGFANGGGTFKKSSGETGTFTATGVQGFVSYGTRLPGQHFPPPPATGGEAKLRVTLSNGQSGVLTIFCVIGSPPPSRMEGSTLVLGSGVSGEYTDEAGGNTIFRAL
jgi:hypothetical protein